MAKELTRTSATRIGLRVLIVAIGTGAQLDSYGMGAEAPARDAWLRAPFIVNCGGEGIRLGGTRVLPDRRYREGATYGCTGGDSLRPWFVPAVGVWGDEPVDLYASARVGASAYRFKVRPGEYLVEIGQVELLAHTSELREFDVYVQNQKIASAIDPFALAGVGQAFRVSGIGAVAPGELLTVRFVPSDARQGESIVSAIWVSPSPRRAALSPPKRFRGDASFGQNHLFWNGPGCAGVSEFRIERRTDGGDFRVVWESGARVSRWIDRDVVPGREYTYRIASLQRGANEMRAGAWSETVTLAPRALAAAALPVYELEISPPGLRRLLVEPFDDQEFEGLLRYRGEASRVTVRLRGASSRHAAKKSYRIEFRGGDAPPATHGPRAGRKLYLKAEPIDFTFQQEKLATDVFAALGVPASSAAFVHLVLNGRYEGVYLDISPVDRALRKDLGLPKGYVYRAGSFQEASAGSLGGDRSYRRRRYLDEFFWQINRIDRGEFHAFVRAATDWPAVRDFWIASVLCHRSEIEANDFFYSYASPSRRWSFLPWDHNNGSFGIMGPSRRLERPHLSVFGQTLQGLGPSRPYWFMLYSRVLNDAALRGEYLDRLGDAAQGLERLVTPLVERNFAALAPEAEADPNHWPPGDHDPFRRSPEMLRRFVREHAASLLEQIATERARLRPPIVINEFQFSSSGGWVELYNRGDRRVDLRGFELAADDRLRGPRHELGNGVLDPREFRVVRFGPPQAPDADEEVDAEELERRERAELERREREELDRRGREELDEEELERREREELERREREELDRRGREELDEEELERREREELERRDRDERERRRDSFPGFAPEGGLVALLGPVVERRGDDGKSERVERDRRDDEPTRDERELDEDRERSGRHDDDDRDRAIVYDWYVYGRQSPGFSYGRTKAGFGFLEPTPGRDNARNAQLAPPVMTNGELRGRRGESDELEVRVNLEDWVPADRIAALTLHCRVSGRGGESEWREIEMPIPAVTPTKPGSGRVTAAVKLPLDDSMRVVGYYFVARSPQGVERVAPLGAPRAVYRAKIRSAD